MPSSRFGYIPWVVENAMLIAPKTVLDIGVGYGKYGLLMREYLDLWHGDGTLDRRTRIVGIEAHAPYLQGWQEAIYDELIVGDAAEVLPDESFDLALLIDVLEHFEMEAGHAFLQSLTRIAANVLICTPAQDSPQGAAFGNEFECHRSLWTVGDLMAHGNVTSQFINGALCARIARGH